MLKPGGIIVEQEKGDFSGLPNNILQGLGFEVVGENSEHGIRVLQLSSPEKKSILGRGRELAPATIRSEMRVDPLIPEPVLSSSTQLTVGKAEETPGIVPAIETRGVGPTEGSKQLYAWAEEHRGQKVDVKQAELGARYGFSESGVSKVLGKYAIETRGIGPTEGSKQLHAWAEEHRGQKIGVNLAELGKKYWLTKSRVGQILGKYAIETLGPGREPTEGSKQLRAWAEEHRGQKVEVTQAELGERYWLSGFGVRKILSKYAIETRGRKATEGAKQLRVWAEEHRGQKVEVTQAELGARYGLTPTRVHQIFSEYAIETKGRTATEGSKQLRAWAEEHRGQKVEMTPAELGEKYGLTSTRVRQIFGEYAIKTISRDKSQLDFVQEGEIHLDPRSTNVERGSPDVEVAPAPEASAGKRAEVRQTVNAPGVYDRIVTAVVNEKSVERSELRKFLNDALADMDRTVQGLRAAFENVFLPNALAEMAIEDTTLAVGYQELGRVLKDKNMSREAFLRLADAASIKASEQLAEMIQKRVIGSMASVVGYSPEMRSELRQFIETVQKAYEARGDVTAKDFRISIVSTNGVELRKFQAELAQSGLQRGVDFYPVDGTETGWNSVMRRLKARVFSHPVFGQCFGVFFSEEDFGRNVPWQRNVRGPLPMGHGIVLEKLMPLFANTATRDINAITLKQAVPDGGFECRPGEGIVVMIAELLNRIAETTKEFATAA